MAIQTINIGTLVNDGTGDDLRTAFQKVNDNFEELEAQGGQANTVSFVGTGTSLYKEKIGVDIKLKSIIAGSGVSITSGVNDVTITNTRNAILTINAQTGSLTASSPTQSLNIVGGTGITTNITGSTLTITGNNYNIETDTSPALGGNLDLNGFNIFGNGNITANNFTGLVYNLDVREINRTTTTFDFGNITSGYFVNPIQFLLSMFDVDMGTITSPSVYNIDAGSI